MPPSEAQPIVVTVEAETGASAPSAFCHGRARRIRKRSDFGLLRSGGIKAGSTRHFTWVVRKREADAPTEGTPPTRLGIVVSTRAGNAVVRNRIKRWTRELFRTNRHELPEGLDLLLIYRPQGTATTLGELTREWKRAKHFLSSFEAISAASPTATPRADA